MTHKLYLNKGLVHVYGFEFTPIVAFIILHCVLFPTAQTLASEVYEGRTHTRTYYQRSMSGAYNKDLHILGDKENDKLAEEHQNKL